MFFLLQLWLCIVYILWHLFGSKGPEERHDGVDYRPVTSSTARKSDESWNWKVSPATKPFVFTACQSNNISLVSCHMGLNCAGWPVASSSTDLNHLLFFPYRWSEGRGDRRAAAAAQRHDVPPGNAAADRTPAAGGPQRDPRGTDQHRGRPGGERRRSRALLRTRPEGPRQEEEVEGRVWLERDGKTAASLNGRDVFVVDKKGSCEAYLIVEREEVVNDQLPNLTQCGFLKKKSEWMRSTCAFQRT